MYVCVCPCPRLCFTEARGLSSCMANISILNKQHRFSYSMWNMTFIFIYLVSNTSMCHRIASLHSLRHRQRRHIWFLVVVHQAIAHALVCCSVLAFIYSCIFSISPFDSIFCFNVCLCLIRSDFASESM